MTVKTVFFNLFYLKKKSSILSQNQKCFYSHTCFKTFSLPVPIWYFQRISCSSIATRFVEKLFFLFLGQKSQKIRCYSIRQSSTVFPIFTKSSNLKEKGPFIPYFQDNVKHLPWISFWQLKLSFSIFFSWKKRVLSSHKIKSVSTAIRVLKLSLSLSQSYKYWQIINYRCVYTQNGLVLKFVYFRKNITVLNFRWKICFFQIFIQFWIWN